MEITGQWEARWTVCCDYDYDYSYGEYDNHSGSDHDSYGYE